MTFLTTLSSRLPRYGTLASLCALFLIPAVTRCAEVGRESGVICRRVDNRWRLANGRISVDVDAADGGTGRILALRDAAGRTIPFRDQGFVLRLDRDENEIRSAIFRVKRMTVHEFRNGSRALVLDLVARGGNPALRVSIAFSLQPGRPWLRRRLSVRLAKPVAAGRKAPVLRRTDVHRLVLESPVEGGAMGQPVFAGNRLFVGLEHPAGRSRIDGNAVVLYHFPGQVLSDSPLTLQSEIIGVANDRPLADAFDAYVRSIRIPPRHFLLYNSWYDIRRRQMSTTAFEQCFTAFRKYLLEPYGLKMDSFVIDDGWQNYNSIWETDRNLFPKDFGPLARFLEEHGTHLGLWMPLTPIRHNLNLDWARKHGYELTDDGGAVCISCPRINAALRKVVRRHIRDFGLNYYKHDFNRFRCKAAGHPHLPDPDYGFEANVNAYMDILRMMRTLEPDIFLNITSNMWLSPWWLTVADTVWRGGGDTGREQRVPFIQPRDASVTYVDSVLWQRFVREKCRFPPSALMTHGIILGRYARLGGSHEPLHRWVEHVMTYLAPGLTMKELYVTPSLLTPAHWRILGRALQWAAANQPLLDWCRMTHGSPAKAEPYGFVHVNPDSPDRLLWFVRNPGPSTRRVELNLAGRLAGHIARVRLIYPWREELTPHPKVSFDLPPWQLFVVEADSRQEPAPELRLVGARWALEGTRGRDWTLRISPEAAATARVRIISPWPIESVQLDKQTPVPARGAVICEIPLLLHPPGPAVTLAGREFDPSGVRVTVRVAPGVEEAVLAVLCRDVWSTFALGPFSLDGRNVKPGSTRGGGWRMYTVALPPGRHTVEWKLPDAPGPFAPPAFRMEAHVYSRQRAPAHAVRIRFQSAHPAFTAPPTPFANVVPGDLVVLPERRVRMRTSRTNRPLTQDDLRSARKALLHLVVFDVNGEPKYRNKPILINGVTAGVVPANSRPIARWEERIVELSPAALRAIRVRDNEVVFTNPTGDCYKIRDIALAVQLADGAWVESNHDDRVYCSVKNWLYAEGTMFRNDKSPVIRLGFPSEGSAGKQNRK